ncbi:hypothetical protein Btru_050855 [Bulinus truncatus]|nr:hypothetical protein Btru_050855 [Bulinus truncatus]
MSQDSNYRPYYRSPRGGRPQRLYDGGRYPGPQSRNHRLPHPEYQVYSPNHNFIQTPVMSAAPNFGAYGQLDSNYVVVPVVVPRTFSVPPPQRFPSPSQFTAMSLEANTKLNVQAPEFIPASQSMEEVQASYFLSNSQPLDHSKHFLFEENSPQYNDGYHPNQNYHRSDKHNFSPAYKNRNLMGGDNKERGKADNCSENNRRPKDSKQLSKKPPWCDVSSNQSLETSSEMAKTSTSNVVPEHSHNSLPNMPAFHSSEYSSPVRMGLTEEDFYSEQHHSMRTRPAGSYKRGDQYVHNSDSRHVSGNYRTNRNHEHHMDGFANYPNNVHKQNSYSHRGEWRGNSFRYHDNLRYDVIDRSFREEPPFYRDQNFNYYRNVSNRGFDRPHYRRHHQQNREVSAPEFNECEFDEELYDNSTNYKPHRKSNEYHNSKQPFQEHQPNTRIEREFFNSRRDYSLSAKGKPTEASTSFEETSNSSDVEVCTDSEKTSLDEDSDAKKEHKPRQSLEHNSDTGLMKISDCNSALPDVHDTDCKHAETLAADSQQDNSHRGDPKKTESSLSQTITTQVSINDQSQAHVLDNDQGDKKPTQMMGLTKDQEKVKGPKKITVKVKNDNNLENLTKNTVINDTAMKVCITNENVSNGGHAPHSSSSNKHDLSKTIGDNPRMGKGRNHEPHYISEKSRNGSSEVRNRGRQQEYVNRSGSAEMANRSRQQESVKDVKTITFRSSTAGTEKLSRGGKQNNERSFREGKHSFDRSDGERSLNGRKGDRRLNRSFSDRSNRREELDDVEDKLAKNKLTTRQNMVFLDDYNCDLNLILDTGGFAAFTLETPLGFTKLWGDCKATHGVNKGKSYFEVKLVDFTDIGSSGESEQGPYALRVGWSAENGAFEEKTGSWSFGYKEGKEYIKGDAFCESTTKDDVLGAAVNFETDPVEISYFRNGEPLGHSSMVTLPSKNSALFPHISLKNCKVRVNFGQRETPWHAPPDSFNFIGKIPVVELVPSLNPPEKKSDCELVMMVGLPGSGKTTWAVHQQDDQKGRRYNILGTDLLIDLMSASKSNLDYSEIFLEFKELAKGCYQRLLVIASMKARNYILDQSNVKVSSRAEKLRKFQPFTKRAIIFQPSDTELLKRCEERHTKTCKTIPESVIREMKSNFTVPELSDNFKSIEYVGLKEDEARALIKKYQCDSINNGPIRQIIQQLKPTTTESNKQIVYFMTTFYSIMQFIYCNK